jgi:hypothetical protein
VTSDLDEPAIEFRVQRKHGRGRGEEGEGNDTHTASRHTSTTPWPAAGPPPLPPPRPPPPPQAASPTQPGKREARGAGREQKSCGGVGRGLEVEDPALLRAVVGVKQKQKVEIDSVNSGG